MDGNSISSSRPPYRRQSTRGPALELNACQHTARGTDHQVLTLDVRLRPVYAIAATDQDGCRFGAVGCLRMRLVEANRCSWFVVQGMSPARSGILHPHGYLQRRLRAYRGPPRSSGRGPCASTGAVPALAVPRASGTARSFNQHTIAMQVEALQAVLNEVRQDCERWHEAATRVPETAPYRPWWRRLTG